MTCQQSSNSWFIKGSYHQEELLFLGAPENFKTSPINFLTHCLVKKRIQTITPLVCDHDECTSRLDSVREHPSDDGSLENLNRQLDRVKSELDSAKEEKDEIEMQDMASDLKSENRNEMNQ